MIILLDDMNEGLQQIAGRFPQKLIRDQRCYDASYHKGQYLDDPQVVWNKPFHDF